MIMCDYLYEPTEMTEEMKKRLCDVISVAPWTELDLSCVFERREQERGKMTNVIVVKNR